MEAVKDPDSLRNQTIERLIELYQTPLLRLCYVHEEETIMEICRQALRRCGRRPGLPSMKRSMRRWAPNGWMI